MTWAHPLVLAAVPFALAVAWWLLCRRAAAEPRFAQIKRLWADRGGLGDQPAARRRWRGPLLALGAAAALLALARPQWGRIEERTFDQAREVVVALDLSRSMLADDVAPTRLDRARLLVDALLDQLRGERVGLLVFAGTAFVQSPLSADYEVLREFLAELDPSYLPQGGTDYGAMLTAALKAFGEQGDGDRYLVVLSDGEAHDAAWRALVPALRRHGIRVIGLGIGTAEGGLVPADGGGVLKDAQGAAVLSRLDPATLQELATETGGTYRDAAAWVDVAELIGATVEQGRKGRYVEQRQVRLQDRFQWFLAPALVFLLLSYWLEFPLSPLARARQLRGRRPHPASAPAIAAALTALVAWPTPPPADAAVPSAVPPPRHGTAADQRHPLEETVRDLIAKPDLGAPDYARLATDTVAAASQPTGLPGPARGGVIDDALAAVDRGEALDSHAADWPTLRAQLEQLKQKQDEPPPQNQPQENQEQQNQSGAGEQQPQQGSSGKGSGEQSDQSHGSHGSHGSHESHQPPSADEKQAEPGPQTAAPKDGNATANAPEPPATGDRPPATDAPRLVGGGRAMPGVPPEGDLALAEALGRMERVKDGDAPAVLFDRMNRAEGAPPPEQHGKEW